ncbi:J domain-containing protein [Nonomuraea sp. NPDC049129]|uniref:J domain-containing protein n=1 Tax=Nonomuraea sp. NPDC049129 TaxID=3155272 RepID=UPI0033F28B0A
MVNLMRMVIRRFSLHSCALLQHSYRGSVHTCRSQRIQLMSVVQEMSTVTVRYGGKQPRRNPYGVLGVESSASAEQITSAYRRLVRVLHPDVRPPGRRNGNGSLR